MNLKKDFNGFAMFWTAAFICVCHKGTGMCKKCSESATSQKLYFNV